MGKTAKKFKKIKNEIWKYNFVDKNWKLVCEK